MELVYFITSSLDGYIASPEGELDWLKEFEACGEDHGYQSFFDSIDGLVLGRRTFEQILTFGDWPYPQKQSWVFTHSPRSSWPAQVAPLPLDLKEGLQKLEAQGFRKLWLVGGSELAGAMRKENLITEYWISFLPLILGQGKPLFEPGGGLEKLELVENRSFRTGLAQLHYRKAD